MHFTKEQLITQKIPEKLYSINENVQAMLDGNELNISETTVDSIIVYITTLPDNKFYIGSTNLRDIYKLDEYIGSGKWFDDKSDDYKSNCYRTDVFVNYNDKPEFESYNRQVAYYLEQKTIEYWSERIELVNITDNRFSDKVEDSMIDLMHNSNHIEFKMKALNVLEQILDYDSTLEKKI